MAFLILFGNDSVPTSPASACPRLLRLQKPTTLPPSRGLLGKRFPVPTMSRLSVFAWIIPIYPVDLCLIQSAPCRLGLRTL